jgi:hypothetical protein
VHGESPQFTGVKIFSATLAEERARIGDRVTAWIQSNPGSVIVDQVVTQSSDHAFHCLSITIFFRDGKR